MNLSKYYRMVRIFRKKYRKAIKIDKISINDRFRSFLTPKPILNGEKTLSSFSFVHMLYWTPNGEP